MEASRAVEIARGEGVRSVARAAQGRLTREVAERAPRATFEAGVRYKYIKNLVQWDPESVADPLKSMWIDPNDVSWVIPKPRQMSYQAGPGYIQGGNWDLAKESRVTEHGIYVGLVERFVDGKDWEETEYVARAKRGLEKDGEYWNYTDLDHFLEDRTTYAENLYRSLEEDGYRTADERDASEVDKNRHEDTYYAKVLEPAVAIGRDGEILFLDGFHRLAIARLLDIDIAVSVFARHSRWQRVRQRVTQSDRSEIRNKLTIHPDIAPLITASS